MKPHHALYFFSFAASLLLHISLLEGTFTLINPFTASPPEPKQIIAPLRLKFAEAIKEKNAEPDKLTDLISDTSNRASQSKRQADTAKPKSTPEIESTTRSKQIQTTESRGLQSSPPSPQQKIKEPQTTNSTKPMQLKKEKQSPIPFKEPVKAKIKIQQSRITDPKTLDNDIETIEPHPQKDVVKNTELPAKPPIPHPVKQTPEQTGKSLEGKIDELVHNYSNNIDSLAEILGTIQFNIKEHFMGEYVARVYKKIARQWKLRINRYYGSELFSNYAFIVFKIDADGNVIFSKLLENIGKPYFGDDCLASIHDAGKFEPLPQKYINESGEKELWMYARFGYDIR